MIEKILKFSIHYPFQILVFTLVIAGIGIYAFVKLPIDAVPDITNNQVQINISLPGYSPTQMEKQVTYVIETALAGIPGLEMTRSFSRNAFSQVTAVFEDSVNIYFARQQINERLSEIKEVLPKGADTKMGPISTGLGEIYMWTVDFAHPHGVGAAKQDGIPGWQKDNAYLTPEGHLLKSDLDQESYLRLVQDWIVKPQLKGIQGVAGIDSIGGYVRQYHVQPNVEQMIALGLTFDEIISSIQKNNASIGPGYIEKNGESLLIKSDERLSSPEQIESIVLATRDGVPIRIKDIAEVAIGREMRTGSATKDGHEAVIGTAMMLIGANSRTVSLAVDKKIQDIKKSLPPDIQIQPILNRTKLVNATVETVAKNLAEGALLVIFVLFLFLGQVRAALITAAVIPLSMLMTAIGMVGSNISGNLMSLGAIDFGLIVDGAVIITENCLRHLSQKHLELKRKLSFDERLQEILAASKEMIQPTVFGQAIIMIVYIPILTLSGIEGKMFKPMAFTVIYALLAAFVFSLTFVPAMIALFVGKQEVEKENRMMEGMKRVYSHLLDITLKRPLMSICAACLIVFISFLTFNHLGQEFVPTLDENDIAMHAIRIPSTSLTQSTKMQTEVENVLKTFPEISYVYSKTGTAEMASDPMPPNVSDTFMMLKPRDEWPNPHLTKAELIASIEKALGEHLTGNGYEFTQPIEMRFNELISGVRSDVAIKVYGDEFDKMQATADRIFAVMKTIPGAADVKIAQTEGLPVLDFSLNREALSRLGINVSDVLDVLAVAAGGGHAGQIFEGDRRFDIFVKLPESLRKDINTLGNLPIPLNRNVSHFTHVPLREIANIQASEGLNEIQRENGKRYISVQANVRNRDLGSFVENAKADIEKKIKIPDGYWIEWGGQFENLISARHRLLLVVPLCLGLILLFLHTAFGSWKHALLVFSGVPLAVSGGIFALWLRDMPFSISAAVGFIALSGIAVLNGLVLINSINQLIMQNVALDEAVLRGSIVRLRPVLMTALVASLGFIPMALGSGTGAEVQKPLATVVIGGLISSTLLTLFVLPSLYVLFSSERSRETSGVAASASTI